MFNFCPSFVFFLQKNLPSTLKSRTDGSPSSCLQCAPYVKGNHSFQSKDNRLYIILKGIVLLYLFFFCILFASKLHNPERVIATEDRKMHLYF